MGGTDNIENPGPYLHRSSKKVPYMGVLSAPSQLKMPANGIPLPEAVPGGFQDREEAMKAYMATLDAMQVEETPEAQESSPDPGPDMEHPSPADAGPIELFPSRSGPFSPVSVPLYPKEMEGDGEDLAAIRTPRWRGG